MAAVNVIGRAAFCVIFVIRNSHTGSIAQHKPATMPAHNNQAGA